MGLHINRASAALPIALLLLAILFVTLTAASMITNESTTKQEDLQQYVDDAINEISSYVKIQHVYGKYSQQAPYHLSEIAIQATPLFHQEINLSNWIIQIQTNTNMNIFTYNKTVTIIESSSVFSQRHWNNLKRSHFGIIVIQDRDDSLIQYHSFSEPNDIAFLTITVEDLSIKKGDYVTLFITPGTGIEKTISFSAPLPTKQVVTLW